MTTRTNVADRLTNIAGQMPRAMAVVSARRGRCSACTFGELESDADALARGLIDLGVRPGHRLVLLVKPGVEFVKLVFALLRTGATTVLVDPGMGRQYLINCLAAAEPDGFIAISAAQAARVAYRRRFPRATLNITVGRRWFWSGVTYSQLLKRGRSSTVALPNTSAHDPAAIIFTSGSTGPPKGVLYTHRMFDTQASEIQRAYDLQPGGVDLSCFALFGLFNSAWGVTTVFPEMDFSRPASADPEKLLAAATRWQVTQAFASPAVWDKLSRHGELTGQVIPTLRKVFSCGAPVPATVLERTLQMVHPEAEMHTPYGATEALPVATIEAREVLNETATKTNQGAGVCVGRTFDTVEWRIIRITDAPIATIGDAEELPMGEVGELIVRGPQVSSKYMEARWTGRLSDQSAAESTSQLAADANTLAKIRDGNAVWHRMGDVGYVDEQERFWYCGRKSQRVATASETLFTECCEAVFNQHPAVRRCALVSSGDDRAPTIVVELHDSSNGRGHSWPAVRRQLQALAEAHPHTRQVDRFLLHQSLPVDVRHNAKINREQLDEWATKQVQLEPGGDGPRPLAGG
ncbi:MAG TPA: fatty acid CoA ligase family protein [Lacipirellula sp.]